MTTGVHTSQALHDECVKRANKLNLSTSSYWRAVMEEHIKSGRKLNFSE